MTQSPRYSRRKLLYGMGVGGFGVASFSWPAAAFGAGGPLAAVLPRVTAAAHQAGLQDWSGAIGSSFVVQGEAGATVVKLVAVHPLNSTGARPAGVRQSAFAAVFEGTNGLTFPAGNRTYTFEQGNGGQMQLFVGGKIVSGGKAQLVAVLN